MRAARCPGRAAAVQWGAPPARAAGSGGGGPMRTAGRLSLFTGLFLVPVLVAVIGLGLTWWLPRRRWAAPG